MGRDKALLPWAGSTLLDLTVERLRACCSTVAILCGPEPRYGDRGLPLVRDRVEGAGPLGAVLTGLEWMEGGAGLFLAVDVPHVPVALLSHLLGLADEADVVVPVTSRGPEPLCAVYTAACLEAVRGRVEAGQLKMTAFWPDVRVREVAEREIARFGDPATLFRNINTPEDLR
jgi:molybdopterin-guanine dinucleotide biosynthesis protein A